MFNLIKKIRCRFLVKHEGLFDYSTEGFAKAKRWAKTQLHPKFPQESSLTLWDYVKRDCIASEYKLHEINKVKTNKNKGI